MANQTIGTLSIDIIAGISRLQQDMDQAKKVVNESMQSITAAVDLAKKAMIIFAGAASVEAFAGIINGAIEGAASLNKLAMQTGATVESLSAMKGIAKITGSDIETVAQSMNRLSKGMAVANEDSKGTAQAIQALGLNFAQFKALRPDEQMLAVAKGMDQSAFSGDKAAIAMALYGREGAKLIPFLKELADAGELHAKVTAKQAEQAENFERNLKRLHVSGEAWKKELAMGMLPALDDAAKAILVVITKTGGLKDQMHGLSEDGSIESWSRSVIDSLSYVVDAIQIVGNAFSTMFKTAKLGILVIGDTTQALATAAVAMKSGDGTSAAAALKAGYDKTVANTKAYYKEMEDMQNAGLKGEQMREEMLKAQIRRMSDLGEEQKKQAANFDANGPGKDKNGKLDPTIQAYTELIAKIKEKIDLDTLQAQLGRQLTDAEKQQFDIERLVTAGKITLKDATSDLTKEMLAQMTAADLLKKVQESQLKQAIEISAERKKMKDEGSAEAKKLAETEAADYNKRMEYSSKTLDQIKLETRELTMNTQQRDLANAMRNLEANGVKEGSEAWVKYAAAIRGAIIDRDTLRKSIDDFKGVWTSVDNAAKTAFDNIFQGGQNVFQKLRDTLKATLLDLLYQMTVRKWIFDITASVTQQSAGVAGAVSQATGVSGAGGMLGNVGSMIGGGGAAGAGLMTGLSSWGGGLAGVGGAMEAGAGLISGGSIAGGLGMLAGALGPVALALGAIAVFAGKGGGPKTEGGYSAGLNIAGRDIGGNMQGSERGDVAGAMQISQGISKSYDTLAAQLGLVNQKLDVGIFFSKDNAKGGTSLTQLQVTSSAGYDRGAQQGGIENVARGDPALQKAIADETLRVILDALKKSDLPEKYKAILNAVTTSSGTTEIEDAIKRITAARTQGLALEAKMFDLTATAAEKLAKVRDQERAAVDPLNLALLNQVYAQQDLAVATAKATAAAQAQAQAFANYQSNFYTAGEQKRIAAQAILDKINAVTAERGEVYHIGDVLDASRETFRKVAEGIDQTTAYGKKLYATMIEVSGQFANISAPLTTAAAATTAVTAAANNYTGALNTQAQAQVQAQNVLLSSGKSISDFIRQLSTTRDGTASPEALLASTRQNYLNDLTGAKIGNVDDSARVAQSAQAYISAQKGVGASGTGTQAVISQVLQELSTLPATKSYQQQQLDLMQQQLAAAQATTGAITSLQALQAQTAAAHLAGLQAIIAATTGTTGAVYGTTAAVNAGTVTASALAASAYTAAAAAIAAASASSGAQNVSQSQITALSGTSGLKWNGVRTQDLTQAQITAIANGGALPSFDVGSDFVPSDMIAVVHRGERITPASGNSGGSNAELLAELRSLRAEVANLTAVSASGMQRSVSKLGEVASNTANSAASIKLNAAAAPV